MARQNDNSLWDAVSLLADAFEALELMAMNEEGHSSPTFVLLNNLNRQLRGVVDLASGRGLLS